MCYYEVEVSGMWSVFIGIGMKSINNCTESMEK